MIRCKMTFTKKSQGLSLNVIIVAAVVLIVLIVLWAIFTGRIGAFSTETEIQDVKAQMNAKRIAQQALGKPCLNKDISKDCSEITNKDKCTDLGCKYDDKKSPACQGIPDCGKLTETECVDTKYSTFCEKPT